MAMRTVARVRGDDDEVTVVGGDQGRVVSGQMI